MNYIGLYEPKPEWVKTLIELCKDLRLREASELVLQCLEGNGPVQFEWPMQGRHLIKLIRKGMARGMVGSRDTEIETLTKVVQWAARNKRYLFTCSDDLKELSQRYPVSLIEEFMGVSRWYTSYLDKFCDWDWVYSVLRTVPKDDRPRLLALILDPERPWAAVLTYVHERAPLSNAVLRNVGFCATAEQAINRARAALGFERWLIEDASFADEEAPNSDALESRYSPARTLRVSEMFDVYKRSSHQVRDIVDDYVDDLAGRPLPGEMLRLVLLLVCSDAARLSLVLHVISHDAYKGSGKPVQLTAGGLAAFMDCVATDTARVDMFNLMFRAVGVAPDSNPITFHDLAVCMDRVQDLPQQMRLVDIATQKGSPWRRYILDNEEFEADMEREWRNKQPERRQLTLYQMSVNSDDEHPLMQKWTKPEDWSLTPSQQQLMQSIRQATQGGYDEPSYRRKLVFECLRASPVAKDPKGGLFPLAGSMLVEIFRLINTVGERHKLIFEIKDRMQGGVPMAAIDFESLMALLQLTPADIIADFTRLLLPMVATLRSEPDADDAMDNVFTLLLVLNKPKLVYNFLHVLMSTPTAIAAEFMHSGDLRVKLPQLYRDLGATESNYRQDMNLLFAMRDKLAANPDLDKISRDLFPSRKGKEPAKGEASDDSESDEDMAEAKQVTPSDIIDDDDDEEMEMAKAFSVSLVKDAPRPPSLTTLFVSLPNVQLRPCACSHCKKNEANVVFYPCRHVLYCKRCMPTVMCEECPHCGAMIEDFVYPQYVGEAPKSAVTPAPVVKLGSKPGSFSEANSPNTYMDAYGRPAICFIDEKDIELVMSQTSCERSLAIAALKSHNGDIVQAIMDLTPD